MLDGKVKYGRKASFAESWLLPTSFYRGAFQPLSTFCPEKEVIGMPQAYCVRCKKKVEIKSPQKVKLKNGKPATKGSCPTCSTKVFRIGA